MLGEEVGGGDQAVGFGVDAWEVVVDGEGFFWGGLVGSRERALGAAIAVGMWFAMAAPMMRAWSVVLLLSGCASVGPLPRWSGWGVTRSTDPQPSAPGRPPCVDIDYTVSGTAKHRRWKTHYMLHGREVDWHDWLRALTAVPEASAELATAERRESQSEIALWSGVGLLAATIPGAGATALASSDPRAAAITAGSLAAAGLVTVLVAAGVGGSANRHLEEAMRRRNESAACAEGR